MKKSKVIILPLGVKIISIIYFIGAISLLILGIGSFMGGNNLGGIFDREGFKIIGTISLIAGILAIIVTRGLRQLKNGARRVIIVLSAISGIVNLISLFSGNFKSIISLIINLWIGGYLLLNKEVKLAFTN